MNFAPIDLTDLVGTTLGLMVALVPVIGFTLRFSLKPLIETYARAKSPQLAEVHSLTARVELLERQLAQLRAGAAIAELPVGAPMTDVALSGRVRNGF